MKQKRVFRLLAIAVLGLLLVIPVNAWAAKKANFSGEWVLNESKSELGEGRMFSPTKMTVQQEGNSITLERTRTGREGEERTSKEVLTLDGKESINKSENRTSTSTAAWSKDGKSLTIQTNTVFDRQGETFEMKSTEVWTMEEDGKILTVQSDSTSPRGERSVKLVYDKK
ncbi:MAG: hypothetical protein R6W31_15385 [Bacteroidales bacterium]